MNDTGMFTPEYPLTFRAAIMEENSKPLKVADVTFAGPLGPGQVLVRIYYSGICGKQIEEIEGAGGPDPYLPHMLGHEGSGIVIETGNGVKKVKRGDHVVLHWLKGSGIDAEPPIYVHSGKRVNAGCITTFNEYGVISENRMTPIPEDVNLADACLLGCAVTTGISAVLHDSNLRPGDSIAIYGCGGVGLSAVQGATLVHGYPIIAIDRNSVNLEMALKFGATHAVNAETEDVLERLNRITSGKGVGTVIITVNTPRAIETAVKTCAVPGTLFFVGVPPADSNITVSPLSIHNRKNLVGSYGGGAMPDRDIPRCLGLYQRGNLYLRELIQHIIPLEQINRGIDDHLSGRGGRCIIKLFDSKGIM